MMKFFPKSGKFSLKIIFKAKFFFFLEKYIFKFHLQILENPKNFMILFSFPLNFNGVVGERIWQASSFSHPQRFVGEKVLFKISFPQEMKSNSHEARWGLRLAPSPFPNQLLSADFKLSFILPIKPKHFPFLRMEDGFHFLQKLKG